MGRSSLSDEIRDSRKLPSNRSFGVLFVAVFAGLGAYGIYKGWASEQIVACLVTSLTLALAAAFAPHILAPLNRVWFHLGQFVGKFVSPIVLGIIFFGILSPVAVIARILGRDELKLKRRPVSSYWVDRNPPGPVRDSFKNQF